MPKARTARAPRRQSVTRSAVEGNEKPFMALCQGRPPLSVYPGKEPDCTIGLAVGTVEAADEATAIKKAIEEFHITDPVMLGQRTMPCGSWRPPA